MPASRGPLKDDSGSRKGKRRKISRGIDHLGWLNAQLRDLSGPATLASELIQNADDAPDAKYIAFDVTDDALIVDNDGYFVDCGHAEEDECLGRNGDGAAVTKCDFHRFRSVAGGDKRNQDNTVGAFGIGFVVVYQVTDKPELISSGRHWIIDETEKLEDRIEPCDDPSCARSHGTVPSRTRFILPWAKNPSSTLRKALSREAITPEAIESTAVALSECVPDAFLFLNKLTEAAVKRNGKELLRLVRLPEADRTLLDINGETRTWRVFHGDFAEEAKQMRDRGFPINKGRKSRVTVAIPEDPAAVSSGLFYAFLPTQQETGLPIHINADFFPSSDRKRLILEDGFQADWNRLGIACAAGIVADNLEELHAFVGPERFWALMTQIYDLRDRKDSPVHGMWTRVRQALPAARVVLCADGEVCQPAEVLWPEHDAEFAATELLSDLGLSVADRCLRRYRNLLRSPAIGVPDLGLRDIAELLAAETQPLETTLASLPEPLHSDEAMALLWSALASLNGTAPKSADTDEARNLLKRCPLAPTTRGTYAPFQQLSTCSDDAQVTFSAVVARPPFAALGSEADPLVLSLCETFTPTAGIELLERALAHDSSVSAQEAATVLRWFAPHVDTLREDDLLEDLAALPLFAAGRTIRPLRGLALPSGFEDPLGISHVVDMRFMKGLESFLTALGAERLDLHQYVTRQLPDALAKRNITGAEVKTLLPFLKAHASELETDREARRVLAGLRIVPAADGGLAAANECYLPIKGVLGVLPQARVLKASSKAETKRFLLWLGVADTPRVADVAEQIRTLSREKPSASRVANAQAILRYLITDVSGEDFPRIKNEAASLAWLPCDGDRSRWYKGDELFMYFRRRTFESQGKFLDLPSRDQNHRDATTLLHSIGLETEPPVPLVVEHLLYLVALGADVHADIYRTLNIHAHHISVTKLRDKPCIMAQSGVFVRPDQAYWADHPYGRFRHRLGSSLRSLSNFLDAVGVRERPTPEDSAAVLLDIERECAEFNDAIDDEAGRVVAACWRMLSEAIAEDDFDDEVVRDLHDHRTIPNRQGCLKRPDTLFLDDRPGWAEIFDSFIGDSVVDAQQDAVPAWRAAGVRPLSEAITRTVTKTSDRVADVGMRNLLNERRAEIGRALVSEMAVPDIRDAIARLDVAECVVQESVDVTYQIHAFGAERQVGPRRGEVCWDEDTDTFCRRSDIPATNLAAARELSVRSLPSRCADSAGRHRNPHRASSRFGCAGAQGVRRLGLRLRELGATRVRTGRGYRRHRSRHG